MYRQSIQTQITDLLELAGIGLHGDQPWDLKIYDRNFFPRVLKNGSLGLGESYMHNWWDCDRLDQFFERVCSAKLENKIQANKWLMLKLALLKFINLQTKTRAFEVGRKHYDLGNLLFQNMLDSNMVYTCAYWKDANDLDTAQINKLELSCRKLYLQPGMRVLDIGCGFGSFAKYAAKHYGVSVVGVTVSKEQCEYAQESCSGLPVDIRLQDYRDVNEKFDRIVSLGMFEHVGHLNYKTYMQVAHRCLKDNGLFLLHTIGSDTSTVSCDEWIQKYIFPNGHLPSIAQIGKSIEGLFVMEDWHNFGADYDKTLMAWHANFEKNWPVLRDTYDEVFYRQWRYYLLACAGMFRARTAQLWQIVLSKDGVANGYHSPRFNF